MAIKKAAIFVKLSCAECRQVNYMKRKNVRKVERKLEFKKYCKHCRKHTIYKEAKK